MRTAVIDLGSNSVRLLVAKIKEKDFVVEHRELVTTRLGRGVAKDGKLDEKAIQDTIAALTYFKEKALALKCERVFAFGTSALREAKNADEFLQRMKSTGIEVDILSGKEEAFLSFLGAKAGLKLLGKVLVIDIGGGSTELTFGSEQVEKSVSLPIGAVRCTLNYFQSDPPSSQDIDQASCYIKQLVTDFNKFYNEVSKKFSVTAVGVGGTFTSISAMVQGLKKYDSQKVHGHLLNKEILEDAFLKLSSMTNDDRRKLAGISPQRADIITAGTLIARTIMTQLNILNIIISEADLMEGYLIKNILNKNAGAHQ